MYYQTNDLSFDWLCKVRVCLLLFATIFLATVYFTSRPYTLLYLSVTAEVDQKSVVTIIAL